MMKKSCYIYYVIFVMTVLDIVFTAIGLQLGIIEEANPIMDYLIRFSMWFSMFGVMIFVGGILIFIYKASSNVPWVRSALAGLAGVKAYVLMLHFSWISAYLGS